MFYYPVGNNIKLKLLEKHHGESLYELIENNRLNLEQWVDCTQKLNSVQDCERFIIKALNKFSQGFEVHMGIWVGDILVGAICIINIDKNCKKGEIGYYLGQGFQGHGYVSKSLEVIITHLFEERNFTRLEIRCVASNDKSVKVAQRLGFKLEGRLQNAEKLNGQYNDLLIYGLVKKTIAKM